MVQMGALLTKDPKGNIPGNYNYLHPAKVKEKQSFQLIQVEDAEESALFPLVRVNDFEEHGLSRSRNLKSDLPVTSDFGEIKNPYSLVFARLEGLQYYTRN